MLKSLGACSPFVSIELGKSYVLTNVRVLDLDVLGRTIVAVPASQYLHLLHAASGKMTHSSNVFIHWSTINSAATFILTRRIQGSVQKSIFINDAIKDFVT